MVSAVSVGFPYDGTLDQTSFRSDHIFLSPSRSVVFIYQGSTRILGYIGVIDWDNLAQNNQFTISSFEVVLTDITINGARMFKLTENSFLLVLDNDGYVFSLDPNGETTLELTEPDLFVNGLSFVTPSWSGDMTVLDCWYVSDNILVSLEYTQPINNNTNPGNHVLSKIEYDDVDKTITKTTIEDLSNFTQGATSRNFKGNFKQIPNSSKYFLSVATVSGSISFSNNIRAKYGVFLSADLTFSEYFNPAVNTEIGIIPRVIGALAENKIIIHQDAGSFQNSIVSISAVSAFTDPSISITGPVIVDFTGDFNNTNTTSININSFEPLDRNHYILFYDNTDYSVYKTESDILTLIYNSNSTGGNRLLSKNAVEKLNDDIFIVHHAQTFNNNTIQFSFAKLVQES